MIFGAIALLVLGAALVTAGIAKSSVALSVASLLCAVGAGALLLAASASNGECTRLPVRPVRARLRAPPPPRTETAAVRNHPRFPDGYEELNASDAARLTETLNIDELHALRRYEVEHEHRKTVLRAIDRRIESILQVRRQVTQRA